MEASARRSRHARIHLDHHHAPVFRVDRELHIGAAGIHADLAQHRDARIAHDLVFLVGQRLRRGDRDRVAGVHAHRIQILDRTDDDAIVVAVAHHFHLEFFPAEQRFLDQQLARRRGFQSALADLDELLAVVGDAAAAAAHREGRADHRREAQHLLHLQRFFHAVRDRRTGRGQPDAGHRLLEFFAVFGLVYGFPARAYHLDAVFFQHSMFGQVQRAVQRGLPAHRRQDRIGPFPLDDLFDDPPGDRLDIGRIRHAGIGHDRGGIRVHQDYAIAFLAQRLAGLRAGIIELARLPDDDGAGADDQDAFYVGTFCHKFSL